MSDDPTLRDAEEIDWRDTNVALIGSDMDKDARKAAAETETAWTSTVDLSDEQVGMWVYRINKFKVDIVPKEQFGNFHRGDSYIVLKAYKEKGSDAIDYDVHFWIGSESTQDEYGTAAYKTVELDAYLDDRAIQHREVQGHESPLFKTYFKKLCYNVGKGNETGFRSVKTKEYSPRLFKVSKSSTRKQAVLYELPFNKNYINEEDAFIIDSESHLIQINGSNSSSSERYSAGLHKQSISGNNPKAQSEMNDSVDEFLASDAFKRLDLDDSPVKTSAGSAAASECEKQMMRLSDSDGSLDLEEVAYGPDSLSEADVFIVNNGVHCYYIVGTGASQGEKHNGHKHLHDYLKNTGNPFMATTTMENGKRGIDWRN